MTVLKVNIWNNKYIYYVCSSRQWRLIQRDDYNSHNIARQNQWPSEIINVIMHLRLTNHGVILLGDLNIDLWAPNDSGQRADIKTLSKEYM